MTVSETYSLLYSLKKELLESTAFCVKTFIRVSFVFLHQQAVDNTEKYVTCSGHLTFQ